MTKALHRTGQMAGSILSQLFGRARPLERPFLNIYQHGGTLAPTLSQLPSPVKDPEMNAL